MKKRIIAVCFLFGISSSLLLAQVRDRRSIHEIQNALPPAMVHPGKENILQKQSGGILSRKVFGYHPYWTSASAIDSYQFDLLSRVIYFSYEVDPATGEYTTIHDWLTTPLPDKAHAAGVKVQLCVTNFGSANNTTLLSNAAAQDTLIANLIRLIQARNADGINIDFESVPLSQRTNLVTFFSNLKTRLHAVMPYAEISVAAPAVDWNNSWDLASLTPSINHFFIMCYDYYWSGSDYAGPVSPLTGTNYNVTRSIDWYISQGVPPVKIIMGVPYYGYDWPVESDAMQSKTTGSAAARLYSAAKRNAEKYGRQWNDIFKNPWYSYQDGSNWRQCWYDDSASLRSKYELTFQKNICGVGIWALAYDNGNNELWNLLRTMFWTPTNVPGESIPGEMILGQNYPNPFTGMTNVAFAVRNEPNSTSSFKVYDMLGREVVDLTDRMNNSSQVVIRNSDLPSAGMYFYKLISPNQTKCKTMIFIK